MATQDHYDAVDECVAQEVGALNELSQSIWSTPELLYEEKHAHDVLCTFLEKWGFQVERGFSGIETAFKASWSNVQGTDKKFPHIVVICEYDALPDIGHACGHNLIAEAGVTAGLAVKAAMEKCGSPCGTITVMGTPAEEGGGGKVKLIENGAFDDVDVAMMVHPANFNSGIQSCLAVRDLEITYRGFSVHASAAPWEGINALDAVVMAYNGLSSLRQQIKPSNRVNAIIKKGGDKANIIPDHTEMELILRAMTVQDLDVLEKKVRNCLNGAAVTTGCEVEIKPCMYPYHNMKVNRPLADVFVNHIGTVDPSINMLGDTSFLGSTDMGNVSHVVPSIHPFYRIGSAVNHTKEFTTVSGSPEAQGPTLVQGKVMARTALDVFSDQVLLQAVKEHFKKSDKYI